MRTFLELQNAVLSRIGDESDQDKMRDLAKLAINSVHRQVLTERRYSFMIWPKVETLAIEAGRKFYPAPAQFAQLWYGHNESSGDWLEEVPAGGIIESGANFVNGESDVPYRFLLTATQNVKMQPTTAGTITITTTGGTESSANRVIVKGVDNNGNYVEETLSNGSAWSTLTSTTSWAVVESITKYGAEWTRTITATIGSDTILVLLAAEFGRQYRQIELVAEPTADIEFLLRFYRKPLKLVYDNDIPQIPDTYDDILVFGSLIDLQGYARPEPGELREWKDQREKLINQMQQQYQQTRSTGGRNSYVNYIPR
jgi:hypothetical protein